MSMRSYPLAEKCAFPIDQEAAAYIILADGKKTGDLPASISSMTLEQFAQALADDILDEDYCDVSIAHEIIEGITRYCGSFEGEANTAFPDRTDKQITESYDDDCLVFIPTKNKADLFAAAYSSPDELLKEFKTHFANMDIDFPESFDWWAHIVTITGTYFC